jgi:hypothetical protein
MRRIREIGIKKAQAKYTVKVSVGKNEYTSLAFNEDGSRANNLKILIVQKDELDPRDISERVFEHMVQIHLDFLPN